MRASKQKKTANKPIPVIEPVTEEDIQENYKKIKREVEELINRELTLINAQHILEESSLKTDEHAIPSKENDGYTVSM